MPKHKDSCEPREVAEPSAVEADHEEEAVEKSVETTDSRRNQTSSEKSDASAPQTSYLDQPGIVYDPPSSVA